MRSISGKKFLLGSLVLLITASEQSACLAKPGDLISHNVKPATRTYSTVTTYRVAGWQDQLTQVTPNLGNYYWEPITKRLINTTKTTQRGATTAPPIAIHRSTQYINPVHAPLPTVPHPQALAAVPDKLPTNTTSVSLKYKATTQPTLTYQDTSLKWNRSKPNETVSDSSSFSTRESVYGVLKTSNSSLKTKSQAL